MTQPSCSERNWRSDVAMASAGRWTAICPGSHTMESRSKWIRRCCTARVRASVVFPDPELPKTRTLMILAPQLPTDRASAAATSPDAHYLTFVEREASASCMRLLGRRPNMHTGEGVEDSLSLLVKPLLGQGACPSYSNNAFL